MNNETKGGYGETPQEFDARLRREERNSYNASQGDYYGAQRSREKSDNTNEKGIVATGVALIAALLFGG